jgi:hypothetical protein
VRVGLVTRKIVRVGIKMIKLTKYQMSVFDGLMISDACLERISGKRNSRFILGTSKAEFAERAKQQFLNFPWSEKSLITKDRYDKRTEKSYSVTTLRSKVDEFFTAQRARWYPNGVKVVPYDIEINKDMLLWWYIGDGFLSRKKSRPNWRCVGLATDSFSDMDNNILIEKLKLFFKEDDNIYLCGNEIMISAQALCCFASLFENECPVDDYSYKFEFGQYLNKNYKKDSYKNRPLSHINEFRKKNKVRELDFRSNQDIRKVSKV